MIDLKQQVHAALDGLCPALVYGYPRSYAGGSVVFWRESANSRYAQADGGEYLAELNYSLEIFAPEPEQAAALLSDADARLQGIGLRREASAEHFEQDLAVSHVSARYRALADGRGNIYQ